MDDPRFPKLSNQQVNTLKSYGEVEFYEEPTIIMDFGDKQYDFFLVLQGGIKIMNHDEEKSEITVHGVHEFSGASSILSNRTADVQGETLENTKLLRVKPDDIKKAISKYSDISDLLLNAFLLRADIMRNDDGGVKLIGSGKSTETYEMRDFMDKNDIRYDFIDSDEDSRLMELLQDFHLQKSDLPVLINDKNQVAKRPTLNEIAECSGVRVKMKDKLYDVLVIGAGPAGLAASVYASSEGLSVLTIDCTAPGGQAGKSSKIENYLGFPTGISGKDLANKGYIQAQKFGCTISVPHNVEKIEHHDNHYVVYASDTEPIKAKTVIAATGASYRRLPIDNIDKFEGCGIYYSATSMHASMCKNSEIGVVGGGNSAGQAALFLCNYAKKVYVIIRSDDIGAKMSDYLVQRLEAAENIEVLTNANVIAVDGDTFLDTVKIKQGEEMIDNNIMYLFTFVGAKPCVEWLNGIIQTDNKGFIKTGANINLEEGDTGSSGDTYNSSAFETSLPGLFAVGDVRSGSVKRVASAVGEGSIVVSDIHKFLASQVQNSAH